MSVDADSLLFVVGLGAASLLGVDAAGDAGVAGVEDSRFDPDGAHPTIRKQAASAAVKEA